MPLYTDHYYTPPPLSTYGQSSLYQSISGFNRAMAPPSGALTRSNFLSHNRYTPLLSPISETALNNVRRPLTRINSPLTTISTKYIPPRPIPINTADIDVSASRFRDRHNDVYVPKKSDSTIYGSGTSNGTVCEPKASTSEEMPDQKCKISRNRSVVRLSTIRSRDKSLSNEKKSQADKDEIMEKIKSGLKNPEILEKKTKTSWREKFDEEELNVKLRDPPPKSPGELLREKHLIKEKEKEEEEKSTRRRSVRKRGTKKLASFIDICKNISSDRINDDLNANELRGLPVLTVEEHQEHLIQKIRRLSSGNVSVIEEPKVAPIEEDVVPVELVENVEIIKKPKKKTKPKITGTVDVDVPSPKVTYDVEIQEVSKPPVSPVPEKKPVKFIAVVEEEDQTTHTVLKLPPKRPKKKDPPKQIDNVSRQPSDDSEDFWGKIGSRETVYLNKRKQNLLEKRLVNDISDNQQPESIIIANKQTVEVETSDANTNNEILNHKKTEIDEKIIEPPPAAVTENLQSEDKLKQIKGMKVIKEEKIIEKPILIKSPKPADGIKSSKGVVSFIEPEKSPTLEPSTPSTSQCDSFETMSPPLTPTDKNRRDKSGSPVDTKSGIKKVIKKYKPKSPEKSTKVGNDSIQTTNVSPQTQLPTSNDGNADHDHDQINKIDNQLSGNLSKYPTVTNLNDLSNETISSESNSNVNSTQNQNVVDIEIEIKTDQNQDQIDQDIPANSSIINGETTPSLSTTAVVEIEQIEENTETKSEAAEDMANRKKKVIIKRKKGKSSETESSSNGSSLGSKVIPVTKTESKVKISGNDKLSAEIIDIMSDKHLIENEEVIKEEDEDNNDKKCEVKKPFDPSKNMRFDSKRVKFYTVDQPMLRPVTARPRPLRKKQIVYSSSDSSEEDSSDGSDESDSENSSDGSYECVSPGISTCSVDSGFVGGSAAPTPKKMLGNYMI